MSSDPATGPSPSDTPAAGAPAAAPAASLAGAGQCFACGYALAGLAHDTQCPECGAPPGVAREFLLTNSDAAHQQTLLKGVGYVLNGIIALIIMVIVGVLVSLAASGNPQSAVTLVGPVDVGIEFITAAISLVIAYGWWLFSEADPKLSGFSDGGAPRQLVRVCVAISVAGTLASFAISLLAWLTSSSVIAGLVLLLITIVAALASIVAFFAQMLYVKWLAGRLPNAAVYKRSKTLLWLGPVLYTFGLLLLGLGPLIALVLYWNMLDKVRKDLRDIVSEGGSGVQASF